jgi:hypothetical protein
MDKSKKKKYIGTGVIDPIRRTRKVIPDWRIKLKITSCYLNHGWHGECCVHALLLVLFPYLEGNLYRVWNSRLIETIVRTLELSQREIVLCCIFTKIVVDTNSLQVSCHVNLLCDNVEQKTFARATTEPWYMLCNNWHSNLSRYRWDMRDCMQQCN